MDHSTLDYPSISLIEKHCMYSRRRSVRRHNKHVLRSARRRQRLDKARSVIRFIGLRP